VKPALNVAGFLLAAALAQSALAGLAGGTAFDLILVAVVAVGLWHGRVAGLAAGAVAGLLQDALGGGVLGLSGLGKCVAGYLAGVAATQFIVTRAAPRAVVFAGGTVLSAGAFMGLSALLGLRRYDQPFLDIAIQAIVNTAAGVLLFAVVEAAPAAQRLARIALERRRRRRSFK